MNTASIFEPSAHPANDEYSRVMELLTAAAQKAADEGITFRGFLPALVDFTAAVGLSVAGEKGVRAFIGRLSDQLAEWKAGKFPVDPLNKEDSDEAICSRRKSK
jgi:hypothetical protein